MPFTMKVEGMEEISEMLSKLEDEAPKVASKALYIGAGIMADEIRKQANSIKTGKGSDREDARYPTQEEKDIVLQAAAGIAKFNKNGTEVDTSVGFQNAGYAQLNNKMVPIPVIVNSINSGTSFMHKQPFVRKAVKAGGAKAIQAMKESIERDFDAIKK